MINLTPRKASRNSVSSFPSPDSVPQEQIFPATTTTPQSIINPSSSVKQSSSFITPTSYTNTNITDENLNGEVTMYNQIMKLNSVSNLHHQYSFKPSTTSSYLKPFMSYFFAHRKNIHDNPSNNKKGGSTWPDRIVFITGSIIFFTLSSIILIYVLNFLFRQKSLPKSSSLKDVIYFLIGEVCTTLLLVVIRLFFNLENSDYDPSITKHLHKISQHGAEVGVLFEYFTLEEREILFYLSNISIYLIGYATNSLCYAVLFELIIVQAGSRYGFFKKDLLGLCVILTNIFCVFLGWLNVRMNDSLEVFLISCSATLMVLMYSADTSKKKQYSTRNDSIIPEECVFILPKIFRVGHIITTHLRSDTAFVKHSYVEMLLVMAIGILGSVIGFKLYSIYTSPQKRPRQVYLGRPMRNSRYPQRFIPQQQAQPGQYIHPSLQQQGYLPNPQQAQPYGTPQQNHYNPYPYPSQYPQMQSQPAYPYTQQQLAFSTPTQSTTDKMFYPPNIRTFTPQSIPQRY